jgi:hypothetical protein
MTKGLGVWLFTYGVFLFVCGAAFFLLTPQPVPTPLLAGAICGGIASFMGVLFWTGKKTPFKGAVMMMVVYFMAGLALAMQQWMLVKAGEPRLNVALVVTAVAVAGGVMLWRVRTKSPR